MYRAVAICWCLYYPYWSQQQLRSLYTYTVYTVMVLPLWRSSRSGDTGISKARALGLGFSMLTVSPILHIDRAPRWVLTPPLTCSTYWRMEEILFLPRGRQQSPSPVWRLHSLQASYLLTPAAPHTGSCFYPPHDIHISELGVRMIFRSQKHDP